MIPFIQSRVKSFANALAGLFYFFKSQIHARFHLLAASAVVALGFYFEVTAIEWCILLICMALVIATEVINTAIEKLSDTVTTGYNKNIKHIKDLAAGAVLITAIASAIIALIIFLPYLAP